MTYHADWRLQAKATPPMLVQERERHLLRQIQDHLDSLRRREEQAYRMMGNQFARKAAAGGHQ